MENSDRLRRINLAALHFVSPATIRETSVMINPNSPSSVALLWLTGLAIVYLSIRILIPVAGAVAAAAIIASAIFPLHKKIGHFAPKRRTEAAFATTAALCLFIGGPILIASWFLTHQAAHAYTTTRELIQDHGLGLWTPPAFIAGLIGRSEVDIRKILTENMDAVGAPATRLIGAVLHNLGALGAGFVVFLAMLVLFLRDGPEIMVAIERSYPLSKDRKIVVREKIDGAITATVHGVFLIAVIQGILAVLGLAIFRVPYAVLLGALCAVLSPIPFIGSALVWIPIVARIAMQGNTGKAVLLAAWFVFIVGLSDNVARPFLLRSKMQIPIPVIVAGVFGGLAAFGISGAFFGPIIAAVAMALFDAFGESSASDKSGASSHT